MAEEPKQKANTGYFPAPTELRGFPGAKQAKRKTRIPGAGLRQRWKLDNGNILEWDYRHGTVEMYDKRGNHVGEFDGHTGDRLKPANPDYRVEP